MSDKLKPTSAVTTFSASEAAAFLGISEASIRNWVRHGYLDKKNGLFRAEDVRKLLEKIESGEINRLKSRANKKKKNGRSKPADGFDDIISSLLNLGLETDVIMLLLAVRMFADAGEISADSFSRITEWPAGSFRRGAVLNLLRRRYDELCCKQKKSSDFISRLSRAFEVISSLRLPDAPPSETDTAGIIYQALRSGGSRSASGSFYTPPETAGSLVESALKAAAEQGLPPERVKLIDPCCGSGQFLLSFVGAGGMPENACGIDSDSTAAFCASVNLLLQCRDLRQPPGILTADALRPSRSGAGSPKDETFDIAATNPPWGAAAGSHRAVLDSAWPAVSSGESFSYFICRCFSLVRDGGIVSAVLPESITNVKRHKDIRRFILDNGRINSIRNLGSLFREVYTPVITIEMRKYSETDTKRTVDAGHDFSFNINLNSRDSRIIEHIYSNPHITLKNNADWALGIVTGDNARHLSHEAPADAEPIIKGRDIARGVIAKPRQFIRFRPESFQQTAPEWKYRAAPKIVYRFISKKLVFAVDHDGLLTLNSANILLPGKDLLRADYDCERIAALFNSDIINFLYLKLFNSVKVLRGNLEQLPLPLSEGFGLDPDDIEYIRTELGAG